MAPTYRELAARPGGVVAVFRKKGRGQTVTLHDAVERGLVRFELRGVRPGDPSQVHLTIVKLVDEPLTVEVPRGARFGALGRTATP